MFGTGGRILETHSAEVNNCNRMKHYLNDVSRTVELKIRTRWFIKKNILKTTHFYLLDEQFMNKMWRYNVK